MKEIPNNNIDTPVFKKDQLKNGTFTMVNKVKLINLDGTKTSTTKQEDHINCVKRSLSLRNNSNCKTITITPTIHYSTVKNLQSSNSDKLDYFDQLIMNRASNGTYSFVDPNKIHLFVKAGQDGRSQGACPFCQDVFIQLLIKAQSNRFNFDVITINLDNPPKEFKELSIKPPVLIHGSNLQLDENLSNDDETKSLDSQSSSSSSSSNAIILSDVDEIAEYLDRLYTNSKLIIDNPAAKKVCLNVFSKFSFFIRDISSKSTNLEAELEKIDNYLKENTDDENKFLNGKTMSGLDCSLLPKLHHIRIAAENIKKFKIPYRFKHLWRYLHNAYQTDAFQKSCPPDREIIWHWSKTNIVNSKELLQIMQETAYKTLSIPNDLKF